MHPIRDREQESEEDNHSVTTHSDTKNGRSQLQLVEWLFYAVWRWVPPIVQDSADPQDTVHYESRQPKTRVFVRLNCLKVDIVWS